MAKRVNDINLVDGEIAYRNFSGTPTQFNPGGGKRTVTFVIPPDNVDELISEGWRVREQTFDDGTSRHLLEATMIFRTIDGQVRDPKVFIVREDNSLVHMTEETVNTLDRADIISADAIIGPYFYDYAGRQGIKAYINALYIKIRENPIDAKYRKMIENQDNSGISIDDDDGVLPFPIS